MEDSDVGQARRQMPVQSMCLQLVVSCEVGTAGNNVRGSLLAAVEEVWYPVPTLLLRVFDDDAIAGAGVCEEQRRVRCGRGRWRRLAKDAAAWRRGGTTHWTVQESEVFGGEGVLCAVLTLVCVRVTV